MPFMNNLNYWVPNANHFPGANDSGLIPPFNQPTNPNWTGPDTAAQGGHWGGIYGNQHGSGLPNGQMSSPYNPVGPYVDAMRARLGNDLSAAGPAPSNYRGDPQPKPVWNPNGMGFGPVTGQGGGSGYNQGG